MREDQEFEIHAFNSWDKSFEVTDGGCLSMRVDYDDVCHPEVEAACEAMIFILNKYKQEYIQKRQELFDKIPICKKHAMYLDEDGICWECVEE